MGNFKELLTNKYFTASAALNSQHALRVFKNESQFGDLVIKSALADANLKKKFKDEYKIFLTFTYE